MASLSLFVFFVLSHLLLLHSAEGENRIPQIVRPFIVENSVSLAFHSSTANTHLAAVYWQ
jgi:hypothetical protein